MRRVAILGAGFMGRTHAEAYREIPEAQVAWVFDRDLEKARAVAEVAVASEAVGAAGVARAGGSARAGGAGEAAGVGSAGAKTAGAAATGPGGMVPRVTDRIEDVLSDPEVDAVDLCLPTDLHEPFTRMAAQAGKHVFTEKPMARTLEQAWAMVEACQRAGVRLMVGHVLRYFPEYLAARQAVEQGQIGVPGVIRAARLSAFPRWSSGWYADFERSGGPILDLMIHDLDFIRWTFGGIRRVYARGVSVGGAITDYAHVTLRLQSGAIAYCSGSWAHPQGSPFVTRLEIAGTGGLYTHDSQERIPALLRKASQAVIASNPYPVNPYAEELRQFVRTLETGTEPPITGLDGLEALRIALAAVQSALSGEPVEIREGAGA